MGLAHTTVARWSCSSCLARGALFPDGLLGGRLSRARPWPGSPAGGAPSGVRLAASCRSCFQPLWSLGQWACLQATRWGPQTLESCAQLTTGSLGPGRLGAPAQAWPAVLRLGEGPGPWLPHLRFTHESRHGRCDERASLPPLTRSRAWPRARADVHGAPQAVPPGPAGPLLTVTRGSLGSHRNRLLPARLPTVCTEALTSPNTAPRPG